MGSFSLELPPRYGVHPKTGDAYWPDENNGFGGYTFLTRQWCEAAAEEAHTDNEASEEYQKIQTYIDYLCGKQWSGRRPTYKSNPIDNRMIGLFWELVSHLTDIRPVASVKPIVSDEKDYVECGNMLDNSMRSWWLETDADQSLAMIVANGILSTAYGKLQWNPDRSNGMGNFEIVPYGMNNVFPLKPGLFLRDSQAIILEEVRALGDIKKKHPIRGPLVQPDQQYSKASGGSRRPPTERLPCGALSGILDQGSAGQQFRPRGNHGRHRDAVVLCGEARPAALPSPAPDCDSGRRNPP